MKEAKVPPKLLRLIKTAIHIYISSYYISTGNYDCSMTKNLILWAHERVFSEAIPQLQNIYPRGMCLAP